MQAGYEIAIEAGAGDTAGFGDQEYTKLGVTVAADPAVLLGSADLVLKITAPSVAADAGGRNEVAWMRPGTIYVGSLMPLRHLAAVRALAAGKITAFATDAIPRTTRAQSMDTLSSMANLGGYKGVLLAAVELNRYFPMLTTAAGMVFPAKVFVIGAGVAGLQAIATARRLGAVVSGYDIRAAVREQVESLGARFVVLDVEAAGAEDKGGYAKAMTEEFYQRQRDLMAGVLAQQNVVITTAAVPGRKAPILITRDMVNRMAPGSLIVDIAAERGGNCELTRPGETVILPGGVTIMGPLNLPSTIPYHASQMYAKNIATFLKYLIKDAKLALNREDEIVRETLVTHGGEVVHPKVREILGLSEVVP
jgi:NAD(P) transhydrogenase subunit alpha